MSINKVRPQSSRRTSNNAFLKPRPAPLRPHCHRDEDEKERQAAMAHAQTTRPPHRRSRSWWNMLSQRRNPQPHPLEISHTPWTQTPPGQHLRSKLRELATRAAKRRSSVSAESNTSSACSSLIEITESRSKDDGYRAPNGPLNSHPVNVPLAPMTSAEVSAGLRETIPQNVLQEPCLHVGMPMWPRSGTLRRRVHSKSQQQGEFAGYKALNNLLQATSVLDTRCLCKGGTVILPCCCVDPNRGVIPGFSCADGEYPLDYSYDYSGTPWGFAAAIEHDRQLRAKNAITNERKEKEEVAKYWGSVYIDEEAVTEVVMWNEKKADLERLIKQLLEEKEKKRRKAEEDAEMASQAPTRPEGNNVRDGQIFDLGAEGMGELRDMIEGLQSQRASLVSSKGMISLDSTPSTSGRPYLNDVLHFDSFSGVQRDHFERRSLTDLSFESASSEPWTVRTSPDSIELTRRRFEREQGLAMSSPFTYSSYGDSTFESSESGFSNGIDSSSYYRSTNGRAALTGRPLLLEIKPVPISLPCTESLLTKRFHGQADGDVRLDLAP
ncbi:hypothetical protein M501DRAFT_1014151 [Patellaria atrata CBS 101060]|uniref:Uncharacterized protein n=1 Tax=Patellaria atrata CBS 101060 TaxID=1346257 RepID=A0A9P4VTW4_9PEZI|nr:hypothetical protein M501DRAFT_1014151 [Patellaria atrata CBS 101060]